METLSYTQLIIGVVVSIVTALGGWETIKWIIKRRNEGRKEGLELAEKELALDIKHITWLENRVVEAQRRADDIHILLRQAETALLAEQRENIKIIAELEVLRKKYEYLKGIKCTDTACEKRKPPIKK